MRWFKDAAGKWYYGDRPYPTHTLPSAVPKNEGLAETTGDVVVTAKGAPPTAATPSPFAAAAERSVAEGSAVKIIETEEQALRYLPPFAGESRARWLDRVGLGYLIQPGDEKRLPRVHSSIGPRPPTLADHGQSPTGGGDGLARAAKQRGTVAKAKRPPSPIRHPRGSDHVSRRVLLQGPPMRVTVNVGRRVVGGTVVEEGLPTTFDVYPDGTAVQVYPEPDPEGTRVVLKRLAGLSGEGYVKIYPDGRVVDLGPHPYPTPILQRPAPRTDLAMNLDALRKHAIAEAQQIDDPALRKAALAVVDAITDLALDPTGPTEDLKGAIEALDALARKQGQGEDLTHAGRVSQDGRQALALLGK